MTRQCAGRVKVVAGADAGGLRMCRGFVVDGEEYCGSHRAAALICRCGHSKASHDAGNVCRDARCSCVAWRMSGRARPTRDDLLAEIARAVRACYPDRADILIAEVERRLR